MSGRDYYPVNQPAQQGYGGRTYAPHQIQVKIKVNKGKVLTLIKVMDTATTTILINKEGLELTTNRILNMVIQTIMEVELVHLLTVSSPTKRNPTNTSLSKGRR